MTNNEMANNVQDSDWWMDEYCRTYRPYAFEDREWTKEIRNQAKLDGKQLPEGWGDWVDDESEDWWMDEYCRAVRDMMFAIRDGNKGGEALDKFLQKWYPIKPQEKSNALW